MDDWKLNARTVVKLKQEHRTFVFLFKPFNTVLTVT